MRETTKDSVQKPDGRRLGSCLAAAVICVTIVCGQCWGHDVREVYDFYVKATASDANATSANVCECSYWVFVEWWAKTSSGTFDVEIWESGEPTGPSGNDYYPPSGTKIAEESHTTSGSTMGHILFEVTDSSALTTGEHTIRAWVKETSTSPPNAWEYSEECTVFVAKGTEVEWETFPGNTALDDCPKNGGKRIFPGKQTYNDEHAADRKKVTVKATITPAAADIKVYFSWWDVDDPCSDDPPLDDNDSSGATGGDNKGSGASVPSSATTDASGIAKATFTVSMQPGDNFKITASTCQGKLAEVDQNDVDSNSLPDCVVMSEMLTVWRKLWVERDYMAPVADSGDEDNWVRGGVDTSDFSYDSGNNKTTIDLNQDLASWWEESEPNHFLGGEYKQCGVAWTPFKTVGHVGNDEIVVDGNAVVGWPCSYTLKDDDDETLLNSAHYCQFDTYFDSFRDAYVQPTYLHSGYCDEVNFNLNLTSFELDWGVDYENEQDVWSSNDFWACLVVASYQPKPDLDADPDTESSDAWLGVAVDDADNAACIFLETIRDCSYVEQKVVAHEVGHTGGPGDHPTSTSCCLYHNTVMYFCDECLNVFRSHSTWLSTNND